MMIAEKYQKIVNLSLLIGLLVISPLIMNKYIALFIIGALLGAGLNYFQFGFRTCSQQLLTEGKTLGIRAVLIMLAVTTLLFFPLLFLGQIGSQPLNGFIQPLSLSVVVGAFIFGIGMQFANGCTSGTFNKLGQLQPLSATSFIFLLAGGTLAAYHLDFWRDVPALPPVSLLNEFGLIQALLIQLGVIAIIYWLATLKEKRTFGKTTPLFGSSWQLTRWHPWLQAGIFLAVLNAALLIVSGQPWSIANIFPVWGLKISDGLGIPLDWGFWEYGITYSARLESSIFTDTVSLTTLGLVFGALIVTLLAKDSNQPTLNLTLKPHLFAIFGGFIMGYGAVIAFGCNIGAFFSGIGSGSLHGWLWALSALAGNATGIYLNKCFTKEPTRLKTCGLVIIGKKKSL